MKALASVLLLATGLVLEVLFLRALLLGVADTGMAAVHVLGSLAGGIGLAGIAPARDGRRRLALFLVAAALFLPVLGIVGPWVAVLGTAWLPKSGELPESIQAVPVPTLPERGAQSPSPPRLGGANAYGRLRHAPSIVDRMDALIALRGIDGRDTVPALKLALRDGADEVRLLAFSMLQERERAYYAEIHARKSKLDKASATEGVVHRAAIAQAYWELAYQELVQGDLLDFALGEAGKHLAAALAARPGDAGYTLLLGRIRLRQEKHTEANQLFEKARALGLSDGVVRPHQAELSFLAREFDKTRAHLAAIPCEARKLAVIGDLLEFWS